MSPEYSADYPHDRFLLAQRKVEQSVAYAESVENHLLTIEAAYASTNDGRAEIHRMQRTARFIARDTPHRQNQNEPASLQAFYKGELLAYNYISELVGGNQLPSGLAHSFLKSHLDSDRPKQKLRPIDDDMERENTVYLTFEKEPSHQRRLDFLSYKLYTMLTHELRDPQEAPAYMPFAEKLVHHLNLNLSESNMSLIGFHMIMREYLTPAFVSEQTEKLERHYAINNSNLSSKSDGGESSQQSTSSTLEHTKHVPTLNELTSLVGPLEEPFQIELSKHVLDAFRQKTVELMVDFKDIEEPQKKNWKDWRTLHAVKHTMENELKMFNRKHELIKPNEFLMISGEYFAHVFDDSGSETIERFTSEMEIHGTFKGVHLVEVPSNDALRRALEAEESNLPEPNTSPNNHVLSPVLRILNPVFIYRMGQPDEIIEHDAMELTIDIPLVYKSLDIRRLDS